MTLYPGVGQMERRDIFSMNWLAEQEDKYYTWLRSKTYIPVGDESDWSLISTPFTGLFNDTLEIYAKKEGNKIMLSDDGKTLHDLELMGVSFSRSSSRRELLDRVLASYGVSNKSKELVAQANRESDFPQRKHDLLQAMLEVSNFYVLAKPTVVNIFKDDVRGYLDEKMIVYTPEFISRGSVGIEFSFDFQVAYREKEIVLKCFNSINRASLSSFLFMWKDILEYRKTLTGKQVSGLAVINDQDKNINQDYMDALEAGGADYIRWQERHEPENIAKLQEAA